MSRSRDDRRRSDSASRSGGGTAGHERLDAQLRRAGRASRSAIRSCELQRPGAAVDVRASSSFSAADQLCVAARRARRASSSSRTAAPRSRRRSSSWMVESRSSDSSSSTLRSQLRVTRKAAVCSTAKPGNRSPTCAAMSSSSRSEAPRARRAAGSGTSRGSTRGHLHDRERGLAAPAPCAGAAVALAPQEHGQVERLVAQVRERVPGVDGQRRQRREDRGA